MKLERAFDIIRENFLQNVKPVGTDAMNSFSFASFMCEKGKRAAKMGGDALGTAYYCLGWVERAIIGFGMFDSKQIQELQTIVTSVVS